MQRLTPELTLVSNLQVLPDTVESRELEFNLARRSGVVINFIQSQIFEVALSSATLDRAAQEIDLDPDNTDVLAGGVSMGDFVEIDSSRIFRHNAIFVMTEAVVGVDGGAGHQTEWVQQLEMDFRQLEEVARPISITNLSHHLRYDQAGGAANTIEGLIIMRYFIVELSLTELGIINAGRR